MDKQQLISELQTMASQGLVSQQEVMAAFSSVASQEQSKHHLNLSEIMYYIGGAIVFLGIFILFVQNWESFNSVLRIIITLGSSIAAFVVAVLLFKNEELKKVSQAFFLISALLAPIGFFVTLYEMGVETPSLGLQTFVFTFLSCLWFAAFWMYRQTILLLFTIAFATASFFTLVGFISSPLLLYEQDILQYRLLVVGASFVSLGYFLRSTPQKVLTGILYGFGSLLFLATALWLGGYSPDQNVFWELVYPLLVFGAIFLSVSLKSRALLTFGTLFLIAYIGKITGEYFSTGLGWPLALVLAGLMIMMVGYYAVRINRKYLTTLAP